MNTKIEYLYRDASNYKVRNEAVIIGVLTDEQKDIILDCLDDGEYFIPHLVGLPEKTFVDLGYKYDEQDDHPYFELSIEDITDTNDEATECLTANEMINMFVSAKGKWESLLSAEIKTERKTFEESVHIPKDEYDRINRLLSIPSLEDMTDDELLAAKANTNQCEGIFCVNFDDGSKLNFDLCSGIHDYWDDVVWTSGDGSEDIILDCEYELVDIEFETDYGVYIVHIIKE